MKSKHLVEAPLRDSKNLADFCTNSTSKKNMFKIVFFLLKKLSACRGKKNKT